AGRLSDIRRRDLIVDAPADVLRPRLATVRPPCVLLGLGVDPAEHIDIAQLLEYPCQPRPFLGQKARILLIAAPVLEIDGLVRDVPVAAEDHLASSLCQRA